MWEVRGIRGNGRRPSICMSETGTCLIISGGWNVWDDIIRFYALIGQDFRNDMQFRSDVKVMAVNYIGAFYWPGIDHAVSHHEAILPAIVYINQVKRRKPKQIITHSGPPGNRNRFPPPRTACHELPVHKADYHWSFESIAEGTSSLLAVAVAICLGFDRIVLAGAPMDGKGHFYCGRIKIDNTPVFASRHMAWVWQQARDDWIGDFARSMSGRTMTTLGYPDEGWLYGNK